jgi:hypothetical protein
MPGERDRLTVAEDALGRVLAEAVIDDLVADTGGLWVAVSCRDATDQRELAERLRAEGRDVKVSDAA